MKYVWILIVLLSACANREVNKNEAKAQINSSVSEGLVLLDVYQRTVTGGKERDDGKHTSTTYTMILSKADNVEIEHVYLYGEERLNESFEHEGKFYIKIKVFPNAGNYIRGNVIQSSSAADIYFKEGDEAKVLTIDEFPVKEAIKGN